MSKNIQIIGMDSLERKIGGMQTKIKDFKAPLRISGKFLVREFTKNFDTEGSTVNTRKWKKLSPSTIANKIKLGFGSKKILERTGRLRRGEKITFLSKLMLAVGNRVPYFAKHQLGEGKVPQRKIQGLPKRITKPIVKIFQNYLKF